MLVGSSDKWEPGLTPVPSVKNTHSFSTVFIVTPETGLNRKQIVNIEGLRVGNRYTVNGKPPSSPKNARTVLQP